MICALPECDAHFVPVGRQAYCCTQHKARHWHRKHYAHHGIPMRAVQCALPECSNIFPRVNGKLYCCRAHKATAANRKAGRADWERVAVCHCGVAFQRRTERQKDCSIKCRRVRYILEAIATA